MSPSGSIRTALGAAMSDDEWRTSVALFRYTLILPLLRHDRHRDGPKTQLRASYRRQLSTPSPTPNATPSASPTLRRWEKAYRQGGFEALKPRPRSDRGARAPSPPHTLDRAEALKRELPTRSARTIADILQRDQASPIPEEQHRPAHPAPPPGRPRRHHRPPAQAGHRLPPLRAHLISATCGSRMPCDGPSLPDPADPCRPTPDLPLRLPRRPHPPGPPRPVLLERAAPPPGGLPQTRHPALRLPAGHLRRPGPASTAPTSSTPPAPPWASSAFWPGPTPPGQGQDRALLRLCPLRLPPRAGLSPSVAHPRRPQPEPAGLDRGRLSPQGPLRDRPVAPRPLPPGPRPCRAPGRPAQPCAALSSSAPPATSPRPATSTSRATATPSPASWSARSVELRYDPFDLSDVEIWFNGQFLAQAQAAPPADHRPTRPHARPDSATSTPTTGAGLPGPAAPGARAPAARATAAHPFHPRSQTSPTLKE